MKAECWQCIAEFSQDGVKTHPRAKAMHAYQEAVDIAESRLMTTNSVRLATFYQYAYFLSNGLNQRGDASKVASRALNAITVDVSSPRALEYRDLLLAMVGK